MSKLEQLEQLEAWARSFIGEQLKYPPRTGRLNETGTCVDVRVGKRGHGAWFKLEDGTWFYRKMHVQKEEAPKKE